MSVQFLKVRPKSFMFTFNFRIVYKFKFLMNEGNLNKLEDKGRHWQSSVGVGGGETEKNISFNKKKNF